jgi:NAD-dependent SIR2 family protein deacetylase
MKISEFLPIFRLRAPNIMFLLGAGSSVSAGIPTAWDMIWDFKRTIFCSENKKPISYCQDLSNPITRSIIQSYFDAKKTFPSAGSEIEYAQFFEALYTNEADRRKYIEQLVSIAKPSYGHLVLASLFKLGKVRLVWTTNFDRVVEDATMPLLGGSGKLVTANLDNAHVAFQALNEGRWPILVKLHGDYQSTKLKNTSEELKRQDAVLIDAFVESCRRYGLAVLGYSGRDQSIIDALQRAIDSGKGFPSGLFWFYRSGNPPFSRVELLMKNAVEKGIDAHLVEIETFDELMSDLLLLEENLPEDVLNYIGQSPRRITDAPIRTTNGIWPILRFNALRITSWPSTCRKLVCDIGGTSEVREAVRQSNANLAVTRRKEGVLYFGSDDEARKAFSKYGIQSLDVHTILISKMRYDSQELGL